MPPRTDEKKNERDTTRNRASQTGQMAHLAGSSRPSTPHRERTAAFDKKGPAPELPKLNCTLAPMQTESVLLPTGAIAEVVDYHTPAPVNSAPEWFLGHIDWEGRQVPVFNYAALISGNETGAINGKTRIMVVKSLSDSARLPYLGILINDIPKLVTVQLDQLVHTGDERKSLGVFCHVRVQDQAAVIPDLDRLTHLVTHAAFGILPITRAQN
ncbi:MAG TPA: chemotaxis protein CheW [Xanthomonadales bacterium]|nr:chemotaxis protein CheW [Xanthomonadales bacterium]